MGWKDGQALSIATGVSAGITEATIVSTPDLIKIRLQDKANVILSILQESKSND